MAALLLKLALQSLDEGEGSLDLVIVADLAGGGDRRMHALEVPFALSRMICRSAHRRRTGRN